MNLNKKSPFYILFLLLSGCVPTAYTPIEYVQETFTDSHTVYLVSARFDNSLGCEIGYGWSDVDYRSRDSKLVKITLLDVSGNTIDELFGVLPSISRGKSGISDTTAIGIPCASIGGFQLRA